MAILDGHTMRTNEGSDAASTILTPEARSFLFELEERFGERRRTLLAAREAVQAKLDEGWRPDFLPETRHVRAAEWHVNPVPADLRDRRVEITGPVDRKMVINALNSGARVFMADFEDATSPTWENLVEGQKNLFDAIRRQVDFVHPDSGKRYELADEVATLMARPRGWHLEERNLALEGRPMSASLVDFGLYAFHNASELVARGSGPYFYLPKLESHHEARLWRDVFVFTEDRLGLTRGTIKATVLIETILAAYRMDEILWELREHSAGLNCGRWDYIFSVLKKFRAHRDFVLPDRGEVGMDQPFLRAYSQLLIQICHRRGVHAMGGMAAQIPIKNDTAANERAMAKVRADKEREARDGHDGTWVAHPALVPIALEAFDAALGERPNQLKVLREDVSVQAADLLEVPTATPGSITEDGLRQNLRVGVQYLEAWLRGQGCVPIAHLMEDAATAEISRAQVWQWIQHDAALPDGRKIDVALVRDVLEEEMTSLADELGEERFKQGRFPLARRIFDRLVTAEDLEDFLTLAAYPHV